MWPSSATVQSLANFGLGIVPRSLGFTQRWRASVQYTTLTADTAVEFINKDQVWGLG